MDIEDANMGGESTDFSWKGNENPLLAQLSATTPYTVPENYFDILSKRINQSIFIDNLNQKQDQGYTIPQHYFNELGANIVAKILTEDIKKLNIKDGFDIPANYFDKLNATILNKTSCIKVKTKVFKLWGSDLMRYASAACFIVLTASALYLNDQSVAKQLRNDELVSEQMLYDIEENVIIEHLQESQSVSTTSASSATELENYILNHYSSSDLSNNL